MENQIVKHKSICFLKRLINTGKEILLVNYFFKTHDNMQL